jgi:hypothetical protein
MNVTLSESCPVCGRQLRDVWGPATEQTEGRKAHKVVNATKCDSCGWARVEEVIDTDKALSDLVSAIQKGRK